MATTALYTTVLDAVLKPLSEKTPSFSLPFVCKARTSDAVLNLGMDVCLLREVARYAK